MKNCEVREKNKILIKKLIRELDSFLEDEKSKFDIIEILRKK